MDVIQKTLEHNRSLTPGSLAPIFRTHNVIASLRGAERVLGTTKVKARPMTLPDLRTFVARRETDGTKELALRAIALTCFWGACRLGNLAPNKSDRNAARHVVTADDITWQEDGSTIVALRYSKTNTTQARIHSIRLESLPDPALCPNLALRELLDHRDRSGTSRQWPLARFGPDARDCWDFSSVVTKLAALGEQTSNPHERARYGGHSFRRGFVAMAISAGMPVEIIRFHGDWKRTDTVQDYGRGTAVLTDVANFVFRSEDRVPHSETRATL